MANYLSCIVQDAKDGKIDDDTAETLISRYQDAFDQARRTMGPDEADRDAAARTQKSAEKEDLEARRRAVLQLRARKRILADIDKFKVEARGHVMAAGGGRGGGGGGSKGGVPPMALMPPEKGPFSKGGTFAEGVNLLMSGKPGLSGAPFASVEGQYKAVYGLLQAHVIDAIQKFETRTGLDTPGRAVLRNVVRESFGQRTGDAAAQQIAAGWIEGAELARKLFNEAGGAIGKRADWGLPQSHDAARVLAAGKDVWIEALLPLLDRPKMIDDFTGAPFGDNSIRQVLGDVWESIVTHGLISRAPGERLGSGATSKQRTDERFLVFDGPDKWMRYQDQFGRSDAFDAMMGHLNGMAHDIAEMQILGPNPDAQFQWLKRQGEIEAAHELVQGHGKAPEVAKRHLRRAQDMWDSFTGVANVPGNEKFAQAMGNTRNLLRSAELGSAILTDMPSAPFFGTAARILAGSPMHGDLTQFVKLLTAPGFRHEAATAGFINEAATDGLISTARDQLRLHTARAKAGDVVNALSRKLPAATLRLSGLTPLFEARKQSFRLSMMRTLHNAKGKSLTDLAAGDVGERFLATELRARGFTEDDWAKIASTESWIPEGQWTAKNAPAFLRPIDVFRNPAAGEDLALRMSEMVSNLESLAVPVSGSLRSRTLMQGGNRPGTAVGETIRSVGMYKSFALNAPMLYGEEMAHRALRYAADHGLDPNTDLGSTIFGAGRYGALAALAIPLTIAGAITIQLKQINNGKDPLFMGTPKFWGAAMLQGGSLGLFGDFFYASHSRFGHSIALTGAGPVGDAMNDVWDLTAGEVGDVFDRATNPEHADKPDKEAARLVRFARSNTPVLSSLIWAKTAYQRGALDQMAKVLDPEAEAAFQRSQDRLMRENGQSFYWKPGENAPSRAPDLSTMWTAPEQRTH